MSVGIECRLCTLVFLLYSTAVSPMTNKDSALRSPYRRFSALSPFRRCLFSIPPKKIPNGAAYKENMAMEVQLCLVTI